MYVSVHLNLTTLSLITAFIFIFAMKIYFKEETNTAKWNLLIKLAFFSLALILVLSSYQIIEFIGLGNPQLWTWFVAFGIVTMDKKRSAIKNMHKIARDDKNKENQRKESFSEDYPLLNSIPLVRHILKWMNKEGWGYSVPLFIIILIGFILRLWNTDLSLAGDEFRHMIAAKRFMIEGFYEYHGGHITTYILITIRRLFDNAGLMVFRLPFVMLGTISTFLIYLIGKQRNKRVGIIAAYLFAFCPLAIGLASYIRGYEITMFMSLLLLYLIFRNKNIDWRFILTFIVSIIGLYLMIRYDKFAASKGIALMLIALISGYIFSEIVNRKIKNRAVNFLFKGTITVIAFYFGLYLITIVYEYSLNKTATIGYLFFMNLINTGVLWYHPITPFMMLTFIIIIPFITDTHNSRVYTYSLTAFTTLFLYIFYYSASRTFQVRYAYFILPIIILLYSEGIIIIYNAWIRKIRSRIALPVFIIAVFLVFSPLNAFHNTFTIDDGENNKNSHLAHYNSQKLLKFLHDNNISDKRIMTTQPWVFDYYYNYSFLKENEKKDYIFFPPSQWYEYEDRTKIWSINGYRMEIYTDQINRVVDENDIDYLVFAAHPTSDDPLNQYPHILKNVKDTELIEIIDEDKVFGYYIFKINRSQKRDIGIMNHTVAL